MQTVTHENRVTLLSPAIRLFLGTLIISTVLAIITGAISIPFFFESSSILYKFGFDKTLLRSGKVLGIIVACLVLMQSVLSARFKFLDRVFALNNLLNFHRITGIFIACCAVIHPVLIFMPEDMTTIPVSFRYWPEFVGVFLLLMILGIVIVANWRLSIGLSFDRWRIMHQWAAFTIYIALFVHVLFVSETFEKGLPRIFVFCAIGLYAIVFAKVRLKPIIILKKTFTVSGVDLAGKDAFCIKIQANSENTPSYIPGQFGFISFTSDNISSEPHPFTIASSPLRPGSLEFVIRTSGDWTRNIGDVQPKDTVFLDGPFGLFTHLRCDKSRELIMIAGGIGITPMLSMLRFLADTGDQRNVTLVWSNRTREHIVFSDEFALLGKSLPGLRVIHVLTEDPASNEEKGRLDQARLEKLLSGCSRQSAIFVCGPPQMMKDICKALVRIGFSRRWIFTERFSL
jgi:predicted ferric reductase